MSNMDSIDIQVSASAKNANAELDNLIVKLGAVQKSLSSIGGKSTNFGTKIKSQSNTATTGFNNMRSSIDKATKSTTSLASAFGTLYANFFWVSRMFKGLWGSIDSTADYMESYNYFNVAFNKIAKDWSGDFEKYGYENAEAYAESFTDRMDKVFAKLSGIEFDHKNMRLASNEVKNLGLNIKEITQYAAQLGSVTNSVGLTGESSLTASSTFTKLAGDLSSLYNVDYSSVSKNLQSGLIGQSRALYKYGIDITNATLQTYAYELGLEKAVSEMTQAEKMQLRMVAILDQSKVAWGNLANEIDQPSNQIRIFKNNLSEAAQVLGQLFIPLLSKVMPIVNGITIAIKNLLSNIAGIMGIELKFGSTQATDEMADNYEDVSDSIDGVADSAKKAKGQLRAFDELNTIKTSDGSSSGSGGSGSVIDLTQDIINAAEEYQKAWDEAYAQMESRAQAVANSLAGIFKPVEKLFMDVKIGDWFAVGQDVSNIVVGITDFLSNAIANVDWEQLGNDIGEFIDGIEWIEVLNSVGKLIWEAINASIEFWKGLFDASPIGATILGAILLIPVIKNISTLFTATLIPAFANFIVFGSNVIGVFELMKNAGMTLGAAMTAIFGTFTTVFSGIVSVVAGAGLAVISFVSQFTEGFNWIKEILMLVGIGITAVGAIILGAPALIAGVVAGIVAVVSTLVIVIKDNWDSIVEWTLGLFEKISGIFNKIKNNVLIPFGNYLKGRFGFEFEVVFSSIKGVIDGLKQAFNGLIAFVTGVFTGDWTRAWNGVKDIFKGVFNGLISIVEGAINLIVVNGINKFLKGFDGAVTKIGDVIGLDISIPQIKKVSIPRYEVGGFPEDGLFFANHNELVGQFSNGKTAVANNEQIVAGIKEGVREAVAEVLAPYLADIADSSRITANKDFAVASRDVFNAVRTESSNYTRRTGRPAFS